MVMSNDPAPDSSGLLPNDVPLAMSELNNLLQIISGATSMLGRADQNPDAYLVMLRETVARAEKVATELTEQVGGSSRMNARPEKIDSAGPSKKAPSGSSAKQRILVVDDEQMTLTLMKHILSDAGFEVSTAESGFKCLEQFRWSPHRFALVILDLTMPFMDGEETFNHLKRIRADLPVLLCTGFIQQERLERLRTIGLSGLLRKPSPPDEILAMVRTTLASVRYADGVVAPGLSSAV